MIVLLGPFELGLEFVGSLCVSWVGCTCLPDLAHPLLFLPEGTDSPLKVIILFVDLTFKLLDPVLEAFLGFTCLSIFSDLVGCGDEHWQAVGVPRFDGLFEELVVLLQFDNLRSVLFSLLHSHAQVINLPFSGGKFSTLLRKKFLILSEPADLSLKLFYVLFVGVSLLDVGLFDLLEFLRLFSNYELGVVELSLYLCFLVAEHVDLTLELAFFDAPVALQVVVLLSQGAELRMHLCKLLLTDCVSWTHQVSSNDINIFFFALDEDLPFVKHVLHLELVYDLFLITDGLFRMLKFLC